MASATPPLSRALAGAWPLVGRDADSAAIAAGRDDDGRRAAHDLRLVEPLSIVSLFQRGRAREAWARVRERRPAVPATDVGERLRLFTWSLVGIEGGEDWPAVDAVMGDTLRLGVRHEDHEAAGLAAFSLGQLCFLRGRYADARRRLVEATLHLEHQDAFGTLIAVRALEVGIAEASGDLAAAGAGLERVRAGLDGRVVLPHQLLDSARAEGWAAAARGDRRAARQALLAGAEQLDADASRWGALLRYEALRAGAPASALAPAIEAAAQCTDARLVAAFACHARALAGRDALAMLDAAAAFQAIGADRFAVRAAADAAARFVDEGRPDSARRAAALASELHADAQGAEPPVIDGLDAVAVALTPRERQLAALASKGLSNAAIAALLALSVRTVESHLYRAMHKRGVSDRRDL